MARLTKRATSVEIQHAAGKILDAATHPRLSRSADRLAALSVAWLAQAHAELLEAQSADEVTAITAQHTREIEKMAKTVALGAGVQ